MKSLNRVGGLAILLSMWWVSGAAAQIQIGRYLTINGYSSFEFEKLLGDEGKGRINDLRGRLLPSSKPLLL